MGGDLWKRRGALEGTSSFDEFIAEFGTLLGRFLSARGFTEVESAKDFLNPRLSQLPSPFTLKDLKESADVVASIVANNKPLLVYGDYDVDGMSGLTLAADFLRKIGFTNFECYQPHRFDEGYGVHAFALERIHQTFPFECVLTVDSGITSVEAAKWAKENKVAFVITDHHLPGPELPDTPFIVNPNQEGCTSGLGILCGTAVLFFLLAGVKNILKKDIKLDEFLDLVALATVADQMQLVGANRSFVREGLKRWPGKVRPGLQMLAANGNKNFEARDIAFSVAPRLNAASRMGQVEKALALLRSETLEEAHLAMQEVEKLNDTRVISQATVHKEAQLQAILQVEAGRGLLVVHGEKWAEGVLGIVAAKLCEEHFLPSIVLSKTEKGTLRGSMRSFAGFHCLSFLEGARDILVKFGGHAEAAGLEIEFAKLSAFEAYIHNVDFSENPTERITEYDADLLRMPTVEEVEKLSQGGPWGKGNPNPVFCISRLELADRKVLKERHVKWQFGSGCAIGFGFEDLSKKLETSGHQEIDALVVPEIHEYREKRSVQLRITQIRPSSKDLSDKFLSK